MVHTLQNAHWQAAILPETGGSIAFGKIRYSGTWIDILRPTPESDYHNPSSCSSFLMLPWANRIRDGRLTINGETFQLATTKDDGTARHGDVRKRRWQIQSADEKHIHLTLNSRDFADMNFPFAFRAELIYRLEETDFIWEVRLTNQDERAFPAGFGHHPYFVHPADDMPTLQVFCDEQFNLINAMAESAPVPISPEKDFRKARPVPASLVLDDLLTARTSPIASILTYGAWQKRLVMEADSSFAHVLLFTASDGTLAVEPQTNANNGFYLYESGIAGSGVFVLQPDETITSIVKLRIESYVDSE